MTTATQQRERLTQEGFSLLGETRNTEQGVEQLWGKACVDGVWEYRAISYNWGQAWISWTLKAGEFDDN